MKEESGKLAVQMLTREARLIFFFQTNANLLHDGEFGDLLTMRSALT